MESGAGIARFAIYAFVVIFCLIAFGILYGAILNFEEGDTTNGLLMLTAALAFGGFGAGAYVLAVNAFKGRARESDLQTLHPSEPWMWREDWASGRIRSTGRSAAWFFWGFAILWNLISTPLVIFLPEEITEKGNTAALIGLLFPLVGIGLIVVAIRKTIQHKKFGECVFQMMRTPGVLGGEVTGTILVPRGLASASSIGVQLSSVHRRRVRSGKSTSTEEEMLWQTEQTAVQLAPAMDGTVQGASVRFSVPYDLQPTGEVNENSSILWRLEAKAEIPGVDFAAAFEIPVFRTAASSPEATEEQLRSKRLSDATLANTLAEHPGVELIPGEGGGSEFLIKPSGAMGGIVGAVVVFLILAGITLGIAYAGAPLIFPFVFGLFALLVAGLGIFGVSGTSRIIINEGSVRIQNSLFGYMMGKRVPCSAITKIGVKGEGQAGKYGSYRITFTRDDGSTVSPLQSLCKKSEAEWLAEEVRKAMVPWRKK